MSRSRCGWRRWTEQRRQAVRALFKLRGAQVCTFVFDVCPECKRLWVETWDDEDKCKRAYTYDTPDESEGRERWCEPCLLSYSTSVSTGIGCGATGFFFAEELL